MDWTQYNSIIMATASLPALILSQTQTWKNKKEDYNYCINLLSPATDVLILQVMDYKYLIIWNRNQLSLHLAKLLDATFVPAISVHVIHSHLWHMCNDHRRKLYAISPTSMVILLREWE